MLKQSDVLLFDRQTFSASRHPFALWGSKPPEDLQAQRFVEFSRWFAVKLQVPLVSAYRCKRVPTPPGISFQQHPRTREFASRGGPGSDQCLEVIALRSVELNMVAFRWHIDLASRSIQE